MNTILLVDDVELFLELEKSFLEGCGFRVATASSGEEALQRLEEVDPSLILLDLNMVGMDGDEVCRQVRAMPRWRDLPVIMVTASGREEESRKCLAAGCDDYLTKPVSKQDLVRKVRQLLAARKREAAAVPAPRPETPGSRLENLERERAEVLAENARLRQRIAELEGENREFAEQLVRTEEVNNSLTNLYIASSRLHSVLDRGRVLEIVKEVVINFVGAEKFALLLLEKKTGSLRFEAGEGFDPAAFPEIGPQTPVFGEVLASRESYFRQGSVAGTDDPLAPLAVIPLKIQGKVLGVLAIYRLLVQKERFEPVDFQIFSMMAEHAATALFSATLYEDSERKRETYRGFMDLLLK